MSEPLAPRTVAVVELADPAVDARSVAELLRAAVPTDRANEWDLSEDDSGGCSLMVRRGEQVYEFTVGHLDGDLVVLIEKMRGLFGRQSWDVPLGLAQEVHGVLAADDRWRKLRWYRGEQFSFETYGLSAKRPDLEADSDDLEPDPPALANDDEPELDEPPPDGMDAQRAEPPALSAEGARKLGERPLSEAERTWLTRQLRWVTSEIFFARFSGWLSALIAVGVTLALMLIPGWRKADSLMTLVITTFAFFGSAASLGVLYRLVFGPTWTRIAIPVAVVAALLLPKVATGAWILVFMMGATTVILKFRDARPLKRLAASVRADLAGGIVWSFQLPTDESPEPDLPRALELLPQSTLVLSRDEEPVRKWETTTVHGR